MLLTSGVNFGFRATLPHMTGVVAGFFAMVAGVGLGLAEIFNRYVLVYAVLRWVGIAYLLYLAWAIAQAGAPEKKTGDERNSRPLGFWGAVAFQWVNPKAWVMAVGAYSTYVPAHSHASVIVGIAVLFALIGLPCTVLWAGFGTRMGRLLSEPRHLRLFNHSMALLLAMSLLPLIYSSVLNSRA